MASFMTANEFKDAMIRSAHGQVIVYFTGFLARSREMASNDSQKAEIVALASVVWRHATMGHVELTQKRLDENVFEYRATRTLIPLLATRALRPHERLAA